MNEWLEKKVGGDTLMNVYMQTRGRKGRRFGTHPSLTVDQSIYS